VVVPVVGVDAEGVDSVGAPPALGLVVPIEPVLGLLLEVVSLELVPPLVPPAVEPMLPALPEGLALPVVPEVPPPVPPAPPPLLHALSERAATTAITAMAAWVRDVFIRNLLEGCRSSNVKGSLDCPA
jgi:hypothetical protein